MLYCFYRPHARVAFSCGDELITKQSHKAECDIHNILKQYQRTGIITHVQNARPTYEDLPDSMDYQQSLNLIMEADEAFMNLPSKVRDHFKNDPGLFLAAFSDPSQRQTLTDFGLLQAPSSSPPLPVAPVPPPEPAPAPSNGV